MTVQDSLEHIGKEITVQGWVHNLRDLGKITFIDLRDHTGLLQLVAEDVKLPKLGSEFVIEVTGKLRDRKEQYVNPKLMTGKVEMAVGKIVVINESLELPFELRKDTIGVNEELRLQYRYLDLRTQRMATNLKLRHKVVKFIRDFLDSEGFIEVETPILTKGTPEGSREFMVPSRLHPGNFYVLPQSPQQFKQLLMVAGVGKYFQIARSFRDEDQRADRQIEFTQLDLEMSFVEQEDILDLNERLVTALVKAVMPEKKLPKSFPRYTYDEIMSKYGNDKPDLRQDKNDPDELAFFFILDPPMFEQGDDGKINAMHHPFTSPHAADSARMAKVPLKVKATAYDLVCNGIEMFSGSIRIHDAKLQHQVFELLGLKENEIQERFGHILQAFNYGVPPHGGIGFGIDRLLMVLAGEPTIREVIAFPKTGDARDVLMGAPSPSSSQQLKDANISVLLPKKS